MAFDTEMRLRGFFRSYSFVHDPPCNVLRIEWNRRRRVLCQTRNGIRPLGEDEHLGPSGCSQFRFCYGHFPEFQRQIWYLLAGLNFPPSVCDFLCHQITSFAFDFTDANPSPPYSRIVIVAQIDLIEKYFRVYPRRPLEAAVFVNETFNRRPSTEEDSNGESDSAIEMLKRRGRKWETKGGEEENCSVCLEKFSDAAEVISLPCDHVYHEECLLNWVKEKQTCPLCRRRI